MELNELRNEINQIDDEILNLFLRRMDDDIHTDETDALTSIKD